MAGRPPARGRGAIQRPPLGRNPEAQLDVIYNEIVLREELGETPTADDHVPRYPHLRDELELHFEVHRVLRHPVPTEPARPGDQATVINLPDAGPGLPADPPGHELFREFGRDGMGVVYRARDHRLRRQAAVKMFQAGCIAGPRELRRFRTEAAAAARLAHPNIIQIFEVGDAGGRQFLTLELADRGTLAKRPQEFPSASRDAADLIATLASAVHHAHGAALFTAT